MIKLLKGNNLDLLKELPDNVPTIELNYEETDIVAINFDSEKFEELFIEKTIEKLEKETIDMENDFWSLLEKILDKKK